MRNKAGIVFIALGAVLILSALLLLLYNRHEAALAGKEAEILLSDVEAAIGGQTSPDGPTDATEEAEYARTKSEAAYLKFRQTDAQAMREKQEGSWKDWFSWL